MRRRRRRRLTRADRPRLTRFSLLLFSLVLALSLPAAAQDATPAASPGSAEAIPLESFVQDLDHVITDLDAAQDARAAVRIASTIPDRWRVRTTTGTIDVSGRWLRESLMEAEKRPGDWKAMRDGIRRRVAATRMEADERGTDSTTTRAVARGAIGGILA